MRRTSDGGVVSFFVLTYAVMWTAFITVAAAAIPARSLLGSVLVLLGAFAPSIVALSLTARAEGSAGVRTLLGRVFQLGVPAWWYLFAVAYGGVTVSASAYMVSGLFLIVLGLILTLFGSRIPKIRIPHL